MTFVIFEDPPPKRAGSKRPRSSPARGRRLSFAPSSPETPRTASRSPMTPPTRSKTPRTASRSPMTPPTRSKTPRTASRSPMTPPTRRSPKRLARPPRFPNVQQSTTHENLGQAAPQLQPKAESLSEVIEELKNFNRAPRIYVYKRNEGGARREAQFDKVQTPDGVAFRMKIKGERAPLSERGFSGSYPTAKQLHEWLRDAGYQIQPILPDWSRVGKLRFVR